MPLDFSIDYRGRLTSSIGYQEVSTIYDFSDLANHFTAVKQ